MPLRPLATSVTVEPGSSLIPVTATTWSPEQRGAGSCIFPLRASGLSNPVPHPPKPESHTHHQDVSTRAGSVSSSSSNRRQARLRRAEAREPSGAADLGADSGTGARTRRRGTCAASSAPPGLSIAPRRPPPRGPEGRGRGTG